MNNGILSRQRRQGCPRPAFIMVPNQTSDQVADPTVARMPMTSLVPNQTDIELFT